MRLILASSDGWKRTGQDDPAVGPATLGMVRQRTNRKIVTPRSP